MRKIDVIKCALASFAAIFAFTATGTAQQRSNLPALNGLMTGNWILKPRGSAASGRNFCLQNPQKLLQIQHENARCSFDIINSRPANATVSYKCGQRDHGVTTIRRESQRLVQISSQGIANNAPFSFNLEARYTGVCN